MDSFSDVNPLLASLEMSSTGQQDVPVNFDGSGGGIVEWCVIA